MNKMGNVKRIIGENIKTYGFTYFEKQTNTWIFARKYKDIDQFIGIYDNGCALRVELFTSLDLSMRQEIESFYPNWKEKCNKYFWEYSDEDSFVANLDEFVPIIINYGLSELNRISETTSESHIVITDEMQKDLYENNMYYTHNFINKYDIEIEELNIVIPKISVITSGLLDQNYNNIKQILIEIAAFYGNCICLQHNGKWNWSDNNNICSITFKVKKHKIVCYPLQQILINWENYTAYGLQEMYDDLSYLI